MTKTRLLQAAGLLVLGGALAAIALVTLAIRSQQSGSTQAQPAVAAPAGAAAGSVQTGEGTSSTGQQSTSAPIQRVITPGQLAPLQAPVQAPAGQAGTGVLPDPHGPANTKPIQSVAPPFADSVDGAAMGLAPLNLVPGPAPGGVICTAQKNCR